MQPDPYKTEPQAPFFYKPSGQVDNDGQPEHPICASWSVQPQLTKYNKSLTPAKINTPPAHCMRQISSIKQGRLAHQLSNSITTLKSALE